MTRSRARGAFPVLLILGLLATACAPRLVLEEIYASDGREVVVSLRHTLGDGEPVARDYDHPVVISDVRVAHILAHLKHGESDDAQRPTIRTRHIYPLAEGLTAALARAKPHDEVIARAIAVERRFGIFTRKLVTAFRVAFEDGFMILDFYAVDEQPDMNESDDDGYEIPPELPESAPRFKLVVSEMQLAHGPRGVAVDWRHPFYGKPVRLSARGGRNRRRTILMEEETPADAPNVTAPGASQSLSPALRDAQLRALDRLDAARRSGLITEIEFQRRRRLILEGRLEEAGYAEP